MREVRRVRGRKKGLMVLGAVCVMVLALAAWIVPTESLQPHKASSQPAGDIVTPSIAPGFIASTATTAPNALLSAGAIQFLFDKHSSDMAKLGVASSVTSEEVNGTTAAILGLFGQVASSPTFNEIYNEAGPAGFVYGVGASPKPTLEITDFTFGFDWVTAGITHTAYWDANLASATVSGPTEQSLPPTDASVIGRLNWAGWSYWSPGTQALNSLDSDQNVPTISVPPQGNGGNVQAEAAVWTGFTDKSNDLLQIGYIRDATGNTVYSMFWGFVGGTGTGQTTPLPCYGGNIYVHPNDDVFEVITLVSGLTWNFDVFDYNTSAGCSFNVNLASFQISSFTAYYTDEIVEAPLGGGVTQQIAKFTPAVNFYDVIYCTTSTCWYSYNNGNNFNIYQLWQSPAYCVPFFDYPSGHTDSTNQIYVDKNGGLNGDYGYPDVSWITSAYDYNYVASLGSYC